MPRAVSQPALTMLDFDLIKTPPADGDVLVLPEPRACAEAVRSNADCLRNWDRPVLGAPLSQWRRKTRTALAGSDDAPVIVVGHQPTFIHPGVWAKHIVAKRLADAVGGTAVNIVVDNDAPTSTTIAVPTMENDTLSLRHVPFASLSAGYAYEQIERLDADAIGQFEKRLKDALGERFDTSMLPRFLEGFAGADAADWVDQAVAGRRAIEAEFGVSLIDHRIGRVWCSPLLIDMLQHAETFAGCYNDALHKYRARYRVRGAQRPIPDLLVDDTRCELPVWIYRMHEARRRLFVHRENDTIRLFADDDPVAEAHVSTLACNERATALIDGMDGWLLRPRALALTLWARLMLSDLFIHGIGGAKYDRITDEIIKSYYGLKPPQMACVSATLWLDLPRADRKVTDVTAATRNARDLRFNPQRHLAACDAVAPLVAQRAEAVARANELKRLDRNNHKERRATFCRIREANAAMLRACPDAVTHADAAVATARNVTEQTAIATNREYFFGLYPRATLQRLVDALPDVRAFSA